MTVGGLLVGSIVLAAGALAQFEYKRSIPVEEIIQTRTAAIKTYHKKLNHCHYYCGKPPVTLPNLSVGTAKLKEIETDFATRYSSCKNFCRAAAKNNKEDEALSTSQLIIGGAIVESQF